MLEAKQYLGEYLRPRVNDPYKLPEALKRVRAFIATEKSFAQKHIEHQLYLAKLQAEREAAEAARQRMVAAIATRKRIWNEALAAAGIPLMSEQNYAMMNASQLDPVLNSRDEGLVLTPELCEQGITRVKAYLAEVAARAARRAANTEALNKHLIAAGLWSIDNAPGCLRHNITAGYLSFGPMAQCVVHALKGLACRARVAPACSPASHCKQCSALTSPSLHAHGGCASPSCAR